MSDIAITGIVAVLVALIAAVPATISALHNARKIDNLNVQLNGGLAKLIAAEVAAAFAKGRAEGIEQERARKLTVGDANTDGRNVL